MDACVPRAQFLVARDGPPRQGHAPRFFLCNRLSVEFARRIERASERELDMPVRTF